MFGFLTDIMNTLNSMIQKIKNAWETQCSVGGVGKGGHLLSVLVMLPVLTFMLDCRQGPIVYI